jgi:hypothetical protein
MRFLQRRTIVEAILVILTLLGGVYMLERRFPSLDERKKMAQKISASYDDADLEVVLQSAINQTDGTVSITVCEGLAKTRVSLHTQGSVPLDNALEKIGSEREFVDSLLFVKLNFRRMRFPGHRFLSRRRAGRV